MALHPRYKNPGSNKFSPQNIHNGWRDVESGALNARAEENPDNPEFSEAASVLDKIGDVDVARAEYLEKTETKHDLVAAIRAMGEQVDAIEPGKNLGRLIHQGLTSYDTEDTAMSLLLANAGKDIMGEMTKTLDSLIFKASTFKYAPQNGYTHSQVAEPITIGKRFLDAAVGVKEQMGEFENNIKKINVCKIKGATGVYSGSLSPEFEAKVARKLGQQVSKCATQILPIQDLIPFFNPFLVMAAYIENLCYSICLSSGDLAEMQEGTISTQTGSSVMAFKDNPINAENTIGSCRKIKALNNELAYATMSLRERDISGSFQVVRHIIPEFFETMWHICLKARFVSDGLVVIPIQALRNVNKYGDFIFAGAAKDLIATEFSNRDNKGIYDLVKKVSKDAKKAANFRDEHQSIVNGLESEIRAIGGDDGTMARLRKVTSLPYNLRNIHGVYKVAGIQRSVSESSIHDHLADHIIASGQMKDLKKSDSAKFIETYANVVRANYDNYHVNGELYNNLEKAMSRLIKELASIHAINSY